MRVVVVGINRIVVRDVDFCLRVRWPDVTVLMVAEGQKGLEMIEAETPDLVMVGSVLPDADTGELITSIREFSQTPLIVLMQEQDEMSKVRFLEAGADDCIGTPFSPIELIIKVKVLLRRTGGLGFNLREQQPIALGDSVTMNTDTREVMVAGKHVKLTPIEFRVLSELAKSRGRVVSHGMLLERAWGAEYVSDVGFIKRYVYRLRQKLDYKSSTPLIISERGIGYRLAQLV